MFAVGSARALSLLVGCAADSAVVPDAAINRYPTSGLTHEVLVSVAEGRVTRFDVKRIGGRLRGYPQPGSSVAGVDDPFAEVVAGEEFAKLRASPNIRLKTKAASRLSTSAALTEGDPEVPVLPEDFDPETEPYPAGVGEFKTDSVIAAFTQLSNEALAVADAELADPSGPSAPGGISEGRRIAPQGSTPTVLASWFMASDPCADERDDLIWARGFLVGGTVVAVAVVVAFPVFTATASAWIGTIGAEALGLGALARNVHEKGREFRQCKTNHPEYYH